MPRPRPEAHAAPADVLAALSLARSGRVFDLSSGWWHGMPVADAAPPFEVRTFRTPSGMRAERAFSHAGPNEPNYSFITEVVSSSMHAGTHLDSLCHITQGSDDSWHGDHAAEQFLGDTGALSDDAGTFPPVVSRGVLLDLARCAGVDALEDGHAVEDAELQECVSKAGVEIVPGDVVLLRTGFMKDWPDSVAMGRSSQPGLGIDGARWLAAQGPRIIGADNTSVEVSPATVATEPQPVHRYLVREQGIRLLEWVWVEELAAAGVTEFLFICLPLTIAGATGSLVRPIAIV